MVVDVVADVTQPREVDGVRRSNRRSVPTDKVLQDMTNRLSSLVGRKGR
jgi:hypothetical protein